MGRIKSTMIKRAAKELVETAEGFTEDFENNKKLLKGTMSYKSVRNKVAGAIVVLKKKEKKQKPLEPEAEIA